MTSSISRPITMMKTSEASKKAKRLKLQMNYQVSDSSDLIPVISSVSALMVHVLRMEYTKTPCYNCYNFQEAPATAALKARIELQIKLHEHYKFGKVTFYSRAANSLLESYATDDGIAETETNRLLLLPHQIGCFQYILKLYGIKCFEAGKHMTIM